MTDRLDTASLWADVLAVRERAPLVHSITNLVVINFNANALLAAGASPVMAHAHDEVRDMVGIAQALVLNIGTLDPYWVQAMHLALQAAAERGIPVVLDPVGAGATAYRDRSIKELLATAMPTVIRANASEVISLAGGHGHAHGVDSSADVDEAVLWARVLAQRTQGVVCLTGATDHVLDAKGRWVRLTNGHAWMTRLTGSGCTLSALVGAFCAVQPDAWRATAAATALFGVAGEAAVEKVRSRGQGVGSLQAVLLDELQLLDQASFEQRLKLEDGAP